MVVRLKRDYHVTFVSAKGQMITETVNAATEYLAGDMILKGNPGCELKEVMLRRIFQTRCPFTSTLIFEGDPTRMKDGKIAARVDC